MTPPTNGNGRSSPDGAARALTTTQAARHLRLSVSTVQAMVERGELSAWRTGGGHRRISLESIDDWVTGRRAQGDSDSAGLRALEPSSQSRWLRILIAGSPLETIECSTRLMAALPDGVLCDCAQDAFDALLLAGRQRPDLLICCPDLMPIDGLALVRRLRAHAGFRSLPAVILSHPGERPIARGFVSRPAGTLFWESPLPLERIRGLIEAQRLRPQARV
jgi:excisionase family DNA binding protein